LNDNGGSNKPHTKSTDNVMSTIRSFISCIVRSFYERPPNDAKEQPQERAARVTANATRWIAYLTFVLSAAAGLQWCELHGQLAAIHADQRPYMGLYNVQDIPRFNPTTGQITWNWPSTNYGKSTAVNFEFREFIKAGDGQYKSTYQTSDPIFGGNVPPTKVSWATAFSAPIFRQEDVNRLLAIDKAIGVLIEMKYWDGYGTLYEENFCMEHLQGGAVAISNPKDCEKQKR